MSTTISYKTPIVSFLAGSVGVIVGYPLDTVKVLYQTKSFSSLRATRFFNGLASPLLMTSFQKSVCFSVYEEGLKLGYGHTASGCVGGCAMSLIACPMEMIKIQMQVSKHRNVWQCVRTLYSYQGLSNFYKGFSLQLMREAFAMSIYFSLFEKLRMHTNRFFAGGITGCVMWIAIYPIDVVKTRFQTGWQFRDALRLRGSTRGIGACLARAFVVHSAVFCTYSELKRAMDIE